MSKQQVQTVLVVDDTYPVFKMMRPALGTGVIRAFHAKSRDEALTLFHLHQRRIDLVVIDMIAPSARNLDLAAELESIRHGLPVLYIVGEHKTIARCSIEAQSPGSVLAMPFTPEQLLAGLGVLLGAETLTRKPEYQSWERLVAESSRISSGAAMLFVYELRQAAVAANHASVLRPNNIEYAFRPTNNDAVPYSIIVRAADFSRARRLITQASERASASAA